MEEIMERQVKFSVRIHQGGYSYESLRRIWTQADRLGYYSATLYDLLNIPTLECWTTLSALAAETERIRLTALVLANLYRPPALLAKMSSTLDVISGGRFELGLGAGGGKDDHLASGYPFPPTSVRVEMLEEAVGLIKQLWTEPEVSFKGRYYTLQGAAINPKPVQAPHPPVLLGGHGETYLLRAVARYADICNIGFEMSVDEHRAKLRFLEQHCQSAGRDLSEIEVTHNTRVLIAESNSEFEKLAACDAASSQMSLSDYKASLNKAIAGTPEQCAEQLWRYVGNGITYFFLLFPDPIHSESLELFAREVMPNFSSNSG
jgi:alkanesulfonate monooxygenase SsuD/methylene tetrahydromethanopterin reductase-like flavin-dependent oxidoreductase (luciferase family)